VSLSCLTYLANDDITRIHETSMEILATVGVTIDYPAVVDVFRAHGFRVDGKRVYPTEEQVYRYLAKCPRQFSLTGLNPDAAVVVGGGQPVFAPGYGAPFVTDLDGTRRRGTIADYVNLVRIVEKSDVIQVNGGILIDPADCDSDRKHLEMMAASLKYSGKPLTGSSDGAKGARDSLEMYAAVAGREFLEKNHCLVGLINSITPLSYDERMLGALMQYSGARQPVVVAAAAMSGATAPATIAGTIALMNAELLVGIILTQLVSEGTPVIYGSASSVTDMRYCSLAIGTPETSLIIMSAAQMAHHYDLPFRGGGTLNDAKGLNLQAAYEGMMILMIAVLSGVDYIFHSAGIIDTWASISMEKFIVDEEICGMARRLIRGYEINDDTLAGHVIKEVGPGGHFLSHDHTLNHFRETRIPILSCREPFEIWVRNGQASIEQRARDIIAQRLAETTEPRLTDDALNKIEVFLRKDSLLQISNCAEI